MIGCQCGACKSLDYRDKRFRASILIETKTTTIAVDAGPDFRQQMLRAGTKKMDALLVTHEHKDHVAGLDDLRAFNYIQEKSMPIFSLQRVLDHIKVEFAYAFAEKRYPGVPQLDLFPIIENQKFEIGDIEIETIPVMHAKLPILGFRFGDFTYITDANFLSESAINQIKGSKVLVLNALQKEPHISHFTLDQAVEMAIKIGVPKVYFTHMSHKLGPQKEVEKELPNGIHFSYDGLEVNL
jgi:phosphoribosyl 1,2-cyclic phosphate phosphodiesterase